MNPPSALHSAMGRDKKPFSYLPGGLDLSQIKSEKMAKRLMRNAMNPGVSETPIQNVQSPTTPTTHVLVPNFNCLPVQVFPSFALPANPKSLLRTRSHPHQPKDFRPESKSYEKSNSPAMFTLQPKAEINNNTHSVSNNNNVKVQKSHIPIPNKSIQRPVSLYNAIPEYEETHLLNPNSINEQSVQRIRETSLPPELKPNLMPSALCANLKNRSRSSSATREIKTSRSPEFIDSSKDISSVEKNNSLHSSQTTEVSNSQNQQTNIKIVEKSTQEKKTTETKTEHTNGNTDADLTVTLPSTKSIPKVDTKVDVKKNVLPDGRVQEITTTTITTTLDGKTEIRTKTATKTFPKEEEYEEVDEEEEEEEEEEEGVQIEEVKQNGIETNVGQTENDDSSSILIKNHESSETTTTKKVVIESNTNKEFKEQVTEVTEEEEDQIEEEEQEEEIEEEVIQEVEEEIVKATENKEDKTSDLQVELKEEVEEIPDKSVPGTVQEEEVEEQEEEIEESEENENITQETTKTSVVESSDESYALNENTNIKSEDKTEIKEEEEVKEEVVKEVVVKEEVVKEEEEEEETYEEAEEEVKEVQQIQEAITQVNEDKKTEEQKTDSFEIQATIKESFKEENRAKTITETLFSPTQTSDNQCDSFRDVPIKLEKVEDIEIKPIGLPSLKKTTTETTEIITSQTPASGPLSTQTELQRVENIVVQKRITTTLDRNYDELTQHGIPTAKSYFAPSREQVDLSQQPTKSYVPSYELPNQKEQRHSLLLDRLSVERQLPTFENYQILNADDSSESQNVQTEEPRAEVLTVSNVKPSSVTNQQWFQQTKKENVLYNNITTNETTQEWSNQRASSQPSLQEKPKYQPQSEYQEEKQQYQPQQQSKPQYQSQPQYQLQSEYQPPQRSQPQYQYQPQPEYQPQPQQQSQPQYQPQPEYLAQQQSQYQPQREYPANTPYQNPPQTQTQYNSLPKTEYQYQPKSDYHNQSQYQSKETFTESQNYQQPSFVKAAPYTDNYTSALPSTNSYQQSYTHIDNTSNQPTTSPWTENSYGNTTKNTNTQSNQYSYKDSNTTYQNEAQSYPSSYVPPPWEQDSSYVYENTNSAWQTTAPPLSNNELPSWTPSKPKPKIPKRPPTAYIPPAPNQSFVKPVSQSDVLSKQPGRKTYYSEYERRYISVPETTYVPPENKETHTQVDSTAQYYYDNDEPIEKEEPAWRKELREFSEKKVSPSYVPEQTSVKPPWEPQVVYDKAPISAQYTPTPTWSQTLKPRSSRETSFETDYVSQEWPRNNSISRGRPLSSYNTMTTTHQRSERSRGVSVDRYNPNNYHSPIPTEHAPVQSHTLTPLTAPQHKIHSRQSRASAEPRELSAQNPRMWGESRVQREKETPIQSRSFKYLQWITGTDE